ncbi:MAG TPA: alpha/beta hydrolase [Longimicrobium sp.]|nr:alpha/beta hydrolase [Longimicrobium sp.]
MPEPLEGHTVVVLERIGDAGEKFHSALEPGAKRPRPGLIASILGPPNHYFAFAVDATSSRPLVFTQHVAMAERGSEFHLQFTLWYRVADPRTLVSVRASDPLEHVRRKVAEVVSEEVAELTWATVLDSFRSAGEVVVAQTLPELQAFAHEYGIAINSLQLKAKLPSEATKTEREIHGVKERNRLDRARKVQWRGQDTYHHKVNELIRGAGPLDDLPDLTGGDPRPAPPALSGSVRDDTASLLSRAQGDVLYRVWYATNRRPISKGLDVGYNGRLDNRVHFGRCHVVIPASHKVGELGSPWIRRFLTGTDDRLKITEVVPMEVDSFWTGVRKYAATFAAEHRHALVFIHGYRVSFKDAAIRAAQLGYDLNIQGPVAFFSWPSRATLFGYPADGAAVEASEKAITEFLLQFARSCGADRVHVIAHSMGNRLLLRALQRVVSAAENEGAVRFSQLILAAPDITPELFLDVADQYRRLSERTTLYVSNEDRALRASFRLQGPRVGLAPPVTCVEGIDTVHVANVDRTLLGHSTFAEARPVLYDIHALLNHNDPPERRAGLIERRQGSDRYWEVRA